MTENPTELKVTFASEIKPKRQKWFYAPDGQGAIPSQTCAVFAGIGGEGKSSFAIHLAALLSRGELEGDFYGVKGTTIIFGPEDPWETVMVPRLMAAGADRSRIAKVTAETLTPYGVQERELKFPLDIERLEREVIKIGVKLIIVDPISESMTGDMNKVQDVRQALSALSTLADKHELTVIVINHFNKSGSSVAAKMSGSHAIRDVVRSYLAFATDEETQERIITQDKNNYGTGFGSWKFVLENNFIEIPGEEKPAEVPSVRTLGSSDITVSDIIDRENSDLGDDDRNAAEAFILAFLRERDGYEAKAGEVIKAGVAEGFTNDQMKNARKRAKNPRIKSESPVVGAGWIWRIEESSDGQGVTKTPKRSQGVKESDMTPSDTLTLEAPQEVNGSVHDTYDTLDTLDTLETPSPQRHTCHQHGTNYHVSTCHTCLEFAKETA